MRTATANLHRFSLPAGIAVAFAAGWLSKPAAPSPSAVAPVAETLAASPESKIAPPAISIPAPATGAASDIYAAVSRLATDDELQAAYGKLWLGRWMPPQPLSATWQAALNLPEGPWRDAILERIWPELEKTDSDMAWKESFHLEMTAACAAREGMMHRQLESGRTPQEFAAQLSLCPEMERNQTAATLAAALTAKSPESGAAFLHALTDAAVRTEATVGFVSTWAATDPKSAAEWCLKNSGAEAAGLAAVLQSWCLSDATAASAWLAAQPAGPLRDQGASALIQVISETDLDTAQQWSQHISDSALREAIQGQLALAKEATSGAY